MNYINYLIILFRYSQSFTLLLALMVDCGPKKSSYGCGRLDLVLCVFMQPLGGHSFPLETGRCEKPRVCASCDAYGWGVVFSVGKVLSCLL